MAKNVTASIDSMIADLERRGLKAEYIVMGKNLCMSWLVEQAGSGTGLKLHGSKKYRLTHRSIPVVVCESDLLEVVPNARHLLERPG